MGDPSMTLPHRLRCKIRADSSELGCRSARPRAICNQLFHFGFSQSTQRGMTTEEAETELAPMEVVALLFAAQHAVAADHQIRAAGVSLKTQNALIHRNIWVRFQHG